MLPLASRFHHLSKGHPETKAYEGVRQVRAGAVCRDPDSARCAGLRHLRARNVRDGTRGRRGGGALLGRVRHVLQPRRPGRPHGRARHHRGDAARRTRWLHRRRVPAKDEAGRSAARGAPGLYLVCGYAQAGHRRRVVRALRARDQVAHGLRWAVRRVQEHYQVALYPTHPRLSGVTAVFARRRPRCRARQGGTEPAARSRGPTRSLAGRTAGTRFSLFGIAPGTDFANAHLEATKTTVAAHFGAVVKVSDDLSFGANFLTQAKFVYSGSASFTQVPTGLVVPAPIPAGALTIPAGCPIDTLLAGAGGPGCKCGVGLSLFNPTAGALRSQPVTTTVKNPSQLALGLAYKLANGWTLLGDYQLTWWSQFDTLDITFPQTPGGLLDRKLFENYHNTSGFRFGAEWAKDAKWTFRGGYLHHDGAAPAATG